jgi:hypothetical protein
MRIKSAICFFDSMVPSLVRFSAAAAAALLLASAAGCASRTSVAEPPVPTTAKAPAPHAAPESPTDLVAEAPSEAIIAIHKNKCGSCHTRVEPGSLARATAESAMQRHRRRAKLSEREWEDMVDYLSADHLVHARPTARLP